LSKNRDLNITLDRYISFSQEFVENRAYTINRYCKDKEALLTDDKFSTEIYLKVINRRTRESVKSRYPIWFLINDDTANIRCVRRSANFVTKKPLVVGSGDKLILEIIQKNREEKSVPIKELNILLNMTTLFVPYSNLLINSSNLLREQIKPTTNGLSDINNSSSDNSLAGVITKEFDINTDSIKFDLVVPSGDDEYKNLGYIVLKPLYRKTLSTVDIIDGNPNFRYIYSIKDPRVSDIMSFKLKSSNQTVEKEILKFKPIDNIETLLKALNILNSHLLNHFTSYDRALILYLAFKNTIFYNSFKRAVDNRDHKIIKRYLDRLNNRINPLFNLSKILDITGIDYYNLLSQADSILKDIYTKQRLEIEERKKRDIEERRDKSIESFFTPVIRSTYIDNMFVKNPVILDTSKKIYTIDDLKSIYNRSSLKTFGCFISLRGEIDGLSIQDYLIHQNYTDGIRYNYLAISRDNGDIIDVFLYKIIDIEGNLRIERVLIDRGGYFILKSRLKKLLNIKNKSCLD